MAKNEELHLIDTSALVNFEAQYGDSHDAWAALIDEIIDGRLKTVRQAWDELKRMFPHIFKRIKDHRKEFVIPDATLYADDAVAALRYIHVHHSKLIDETGTGNPADPFLIAAAKAVNGIVVTDEKSSGPGHKRRIPYVCLNVNIGCKSGADYFKDIGL